MSPARKKNLLLLRGISFPGPADFQTWVFVAAGLSLILIAARSLPEVVEENWVERQSVEQSAEVDAASMSSNGRKAAAAPSAAQAWWVEGVGDRKSAFFAELAPLVEEVNQGVLRERDAIAKLEQAYRVNGSLTSRKLAQLNRYLEAYQLEPVSEPSAIVFRRLLKRADIVPPSLALAQAALESGWGTSRFARQGNNLFGMWCYEPGCGIVPKRRPPGRTYEVAAYRDPKESLRAYVRNLNTNPSYAEFREIRYQHRLHGAELSGYDLAEGLVRYSQERWVYVDKVRDLIRQNRLERI